MDAALPAADITMTRGISVRMTRAAHNSEIFSSIVKDYQ
jgi:hypothetical protein